MKELWEAALSYDVGAVHVLCDWLLEQGDERGQVIAMLTTEGFELADGALEPGFSAVLRAKRDGSWMRTRSWFDESIRSMNEWFKEVYGGYARPPLKYESDRVFRSIQAWLDDPYTGAFGAIEIIPSPYVREGEALLVNGQVFTGRIIDEHADHVAGHAAALAEAINARPAAGVEAREIDGRIVLASTPAGRISIVEHMLEHSMLYGTGAVRLTWNQGERPIGQRFERPVVLSRHRARSERLDALMRSAGHRAGEPRVPEFIPQRRLDGRRAR